MARSITRARTLADRYELGAVIGSGGMGEVRQAYDRRLRRDVAVKVLHPDVSGDPTARARFEQEARAAARVNHPNVVEVYDIGEDDGALYIVMECLPGRTLGDELRQGRLPIDDARRVAVEMLTALEAAHRLDVVHRDVKPGNILFATDGRAQLADFGIAKAAESTDLTATGILIGTPHYLPPERLRGERATASGDVFSLGIVLYESLAGHRPYAGTTPSTLMASMAQPAASIGAIRPDVDEGLGTAVDRAIAINPADRFTSAADMRDAITASSAAASSFAAPLSAGTDPTVVADATQVAPASPSTIESGTAGPRPLSPPVPVPPPAPRSRPGRLPRRRRRALAAVAVVIVILAFALAAVAMGSAGPPAPARPPASPTTTVVPTTAVPAVVPTSPTQAPTTTPSPPTTDPPSSVPTTLATTTPTTDPGDQNGNGGTVKQSRRKGAKDDRRP